MQVAPKDVPELGIVDKAGAEGSGVTDEDRGQVLNVSSSRAFRAVMILLATELCTPTLSAIHRHTTPRPTRPDDAPDPRPDDGVGEAARWCYPEQR